MTDPAQFVFLSEWESQDALDAHYRSRLFADFQFDLQGLLARPSELTIYSTGLRCGRRTRGRWTPVTQTRRLRRAY